MSPLLTLLAAAHAQPAAPEDPFLWLEEVEGARALEAVRGWNGATTSALEADPRFATFRAEALQLLTSEARIPSGDFQGDRVVGFWRDEAHVRGLWRSTTAKSYLAGAPVWETLLDVDALEAAEHQNWLWEGADCLPGSDRCLVRLSRGGTDASVVREFSKTTRTFLDGGFVLPEAKSDVAWVDADTLLVATDRGEGTLTSSGYARTVVRWTRGTPLADAEVLFEGAVTDVSTTPLVVRHGKQRAVLLVRGRTFYESDYLLVPDRGPPVPLAIPARSELAGLFEGALLVLLREAWAEHALPSGALVSVPLDGRAPALVLASPANGAIAGVGVGRKSLFVQLTEDVVGRLARLRPTSNGWERSDVALPANGVVTLEATSDSRDDALVSFESLTVPNTLFAVDRRDEVHALFALPAFYDATDVVVEQRFATSADGTRVPYFVMAKRSVLASGPAPTLQYGYGGFLAAILPVYFDEEARPQHGALAGKAWVARGGVLVLSNGRGGSEYGPAWHAAALKEHRQRAFDDFFAIGEALVATGVTTKDQLGAIGRSNGGLLMGVAFTQRPDLYAAIDCGVPLLDMLRYHQLLAGASWMGEYGDPDVPAEREVLLAYSPYQNVRPGVTYPSVFFYTSTKDDRVHPGHARKMAALLQSMAVPFDYYENTEGGHGGVANQQQSAYRLALEYTWLARELGLGDGGVQAP